MTPAEVFEVARVEARKVYETAISEADAAYHKTVNAGLRSYNAGHALLEIAARAASDRATAEYLSAVNAASDVFQEAMKNA